MPGWQYRIGSLHKRFFSIQNSGLNAVHSYYFDLNSNGSPNY